MKTNITIMLSVESYREVIGVLYLRLGKHKHTKKRIAQGSCLRKSKKLMYFLKFFSCSAIIIVYLNLHYSSVILRNLTSEGGVESNPGPRPFAIRKAVKHHQSDMRYGSDSAGKQCTANAHFAIIFSSIKRVSLWKSFDLHCVLEQGDKIFKNVCENKKLYEYLAVDELPLNFPLEGTNVSARRLAHESLLFAEKNNLFENYRHYSESDRGNGAIFTCAGYSVATICAENNRFLFDSHSRNTYGLHDPNGKAGNLLSFSTVSSLNNYIKSFYEISSNISSETQYDLQYISIEINTEIKKEIVSKLGRKRKAVYNKSSNMKRGESKTGTKTSKKKEK